jgi:hypothetical protein
MADPVNPLALSDEDFAKFNTPEEVSGNAAPVVETPAEPVVEAPVVEAPAAVETPVVPAAAEPTAPVVEAPKAEEPVAEPDDKSFPAVPPAVEEPKAEAKPEENPAEPEAKTEAEGEEKPKAEGEAEAPALNYAEIGELIMKPFKANGKMIEVKTPDEAIKLMQMGAHYTRKMQAIQPHRKVLTMLENNGLLDEDRLGFLIDIDKKNPEAIKKLIKDAGIDPLEIDTGVEPAYEGGSHKVTDAEMDFSTAVEDLVSSDGGKESLEVFNTTWDQASKELVFAEPGLLQTMHTQKQNGIYDRIAAEIDRQRTLGTITVNTPFISAYQTVGTELHNAGAFNDLAPKVNPPASDEGKPPIVSAETTAAPQPVATRAAAPKVVVDNGDKVVAASPTNTSARPAKPVVDIFAMSDEDFMASMKGRV